MKKKTKTTIICASALSLFAIGAGVGITYAGYATSTTLPTATNVGVGGSYRILYLDVSVDLKQGETWALDNPAFWVYAFYKNGNTETNFGWYRGAKDETVAHNQYRFSVPQNYANNQEPNTFVFTRVVNTATSPEFGVNVWSQTDNQTSSNYGANNVCKITSWNGSDNGNATTAWYSHPSYSIYTISLDNQEADEGGNASIFYRNNNESGNANVKDYYTDAACSEENKMVANSNPKITPPTRDGYAFGGYYTQENGQGTLILNADGSLSSAASGVTFSGYSTLYAKWTAA